MFGRFPVLPVVGLVSTIAVSEVDAAAIFFVDDESGFNTEVAAKSYNSQGVEDFESSILGPNMVVQFSDPLGPMSMPGPFPNGTLDAPGVTIQANTLGNSPTSPSAGGGSALVTASVGAFDTPSDQVGNTQPSHSIDLIFAPMDGIPVRAVSLSPLYVDAASTNRNSNPGIIVVRVYGPSDTLIGMVTMMDVDYSQDDFLGISTDSLDQIVRVNIVDASLDDDFVGADDIEVFTSTTPVELLQFDVE